MKEKALLVDIDGTLANVEHRVHLLNVDSDKDETDRDKFHSAMDKDGINQWCLEIITKFKNDNYKILLLTGRPGRYRQKSLDWLAENNIPYDELLMREEGDKRRDHIIKKEIYTEQVDPNYEILFVLEDRLSVVKMWRDCGLTCLQCDWGDF